MTKTALSSLFTLVLLASGLNAQLSTVRQDIYGMD